MSQPIKIVVMYPKFLSQEINNKTLGTGNLPADFVEFIITMNHKVMIKTIIISSRTIGQYIS